MYATNLHIERTHRIYIATLYSHVCTNVLRTQLYQTRRSIKGFIRLLTDSANITAPKSHISSRDDEYVARARFTTLRIDNTTTRGCAHKRHRSQKSLQHMNIYLYMCIMYIRVFSIYVHEPTRV